jgi:hypothetical protein
MDLKTFIDFIQTKDNVDDILSNFKTQSEKGFVYERLWDIIIKFGFCPKFPNSKFIHKIGNMNTGSLKDLISIQHYIENNKLISGNSGGCSDITLYSKNTNEYYFISSKYSDKKDNSIDYYDVQNIIAVIENNKALYTKYKIFILVFDKKNVLQKVKQSNSSSNYMTKHMTKDCIFDKEDLQKYFLEFKNTIKNYHIKQYNEIFLSGKDKLCMRFHQEFITQKTSDLILKGQKQFLWGCKCRSGKTFMVGGLIIKQRKEKFNVLIITPAPTETIPQFTEDLFHKYYDFNDFAIHSIEGSNSIQKINLSKNNIFIASKQLLQKYTEQSSKTTISIIKDLGLDLIIFDENHFTGTTDLSKEILQSYSSKDTVKVYLTATYNKPLKEWNIPNECQMFWDIEDEQFCKFQDVESLIEKHGENVIQTINHFNTLGKNKDNIFNSYLSMPNLHLITTMFDHQRYENIMTEIEQKNSKQGFSFDTLFSINKKSNKLNFEKDVKKMLQYISGSNKSGDYPEGDKSIFGRIETLCSDCGSRSPFTQLWFLPPNCIDEISICLKEIMNKDVELKNYEVMIINSKQKLQSDIKTEIENKELEARNNGKLGLILLVGNMLSLGITLKNCDVVMLFNNTLSCDKVMQQMYRCMTEDEDKKIGIVVDLNISRVLNTCINYGIYKKDLNIEEKVKYLIKNHLINIDKDLFIYKEIDTEILVKRMMELWQSDPIHSFINLLKNLENEYIDFDNDTQKLLNKSFTSSTGNKINVTMKIDDSSPEQPLKSGKEQILDPDTDSDDENSDSDNSSKLSAKEVQISFTKDVLPYVIPLVCILTYKDNNKDFLTMLKSVQCNPELLEIFDQQSLIWWNKNNLIEIIKSIIERNFTKDSNIFNISIQFKMALQSLIDRPKELLELINECLKPKEEEKKKFGEVFTSMDLVNEMLDKLPGTVWTKSNLTWFDPAAGMGNFPIAIYLRLMESLKKEFPEEKDRKRHIIEKMLYMSELNKKNVYIIKEIFDINNEYKLNLYEGDTLNLDTFKTFNLKTFDIIIGNPPYQQTDDKGVSKGGGNNLYTKFIYQAYDLLKNEGYLVFINPPTFFGAGRSNNKDDMNIRKDVFNNCNILHINLEECSKYFPNVGSLFIYYIMQKNNVANEKLEVLCRYNKTNYKSIIDQKILNDMNYIPYLLNNTSINICKKIKDTENKLKIFNQMTFDKRRPYMSVNKTDEFKYPIQATGVQVVYSSKQCKYQYDKKILMSRSGYLRPFYDDGITGVGSDCFCYVVKDKKEADYVINLIKSKLYTFYININKWSGFHHLTVLQDLPYIEIKDITDEKIYKYFNLTEDEINLIENIIEPPKIEVEKVKSETYPIITKGKTKYYVIKTLSSSIEIEFDDKPEIIETFEDRVYKIKRDKSIGDFVGVYKDGNIVSY